MDVINIFVSRRIEDVYKRQIPFHAVINIQGRRIAKLRVHKIILQGALDTVQYLSLIHI